MGAFLKIEVGILSENLVWKRPMSGIFKDSEGSGRLRSTPSASLQGSLKPRRLYPERISI